MSDTPSHRAGTNPVAQSNIGPIASLASNSAAARFWFVMFMAVVAAAILMQTLTVMWIKSDTKVVVIDPSGTFYVAPLLGFERPSNLHRHLATLATIARFTFNPNGPNYPEIMEQVFIDPLKSQIFEEVKSEIPQFRERTMTQTPHIQKYTVIRASSTEAVIVVEGYLERHAQFRGKEVPAPNLGFRISYTFAKNPRMQDSGRFPMAAYQYTTDFWELDPNRPQ